MYNLDTSFKCIKPIFQNKKSIIYKGEKFPIDFDAIKKNSQFFYDNRKKYKKMEEIEIPEEPIDISNKAMQDFISCCSNSPCKLDESNVLPLHILSIRYGVPELTKLTTNFLSKNEKKMVIQSILFKAQLLKAQQSDFSENIQINIDTKIEEDEISSNLIEYLQNNIDDLLSLPIPILYHIINDFYSKSKYSIDSSKEDLIASFLFKCLDKYKREASVLFTSIDFANQRKRILYRLLEEYKDTFDFNMLNPESLLKTTSELMSEVAKLHIENSKLRDDIDAIRQEQREEKKEFNDFKNMVNDQFKKIIFEFNSKIDQISIDQNKVKDEMDQKVSKEDLYLYQEKKEFEEFKIKLNENLRKTDGFKDEKQNNFINKSDQNVNDQNKINDEMNNDAAKAMIFPYEKNKEFRGILYYLQKLSKGNVVDEVEISSSSIADNHERYSPINAIKYNNEKTDFRSENKPNSWILIDFKKHRVAPKYYSIKSIEGSKDSSAHLKSWIIEGSNDNKKWKVIDEQNDCFLLNGPSLAHTFYIENSYLEEFRFLRLRQPQKNIRGDNYLCLSSIEFFGKLL